jgi:hypothetical protein
LEVGPEKTDQRESDNDQKVEEIYKSRQSGLVKIFWSVLSINYVDSNHHEDYCERGVVIHFSVDNFEIGVVSWEFN